MPYSAAQDVRREMFSYIFEKNPDAAVLALNEILEKDAGLSSNFNFTEVLGADFWFELKDKHPTLAIHPSFFLAGIHNTSVANQKKIQDELSQVFLPKIILTRSGTGSSIFGIKTKKQWCLVF